MIEAKIVPDVWNYGRKIWQLNLGPVVESAAKFYWYLSFLSYRVAESLGI